METTAKKIDKTTRTAREMAETQRDSFEALAENFAGVQRRGMGIAEGGLEFMKLQEDNARAIQEWFATGVRLLQLQGRNAEFVQSWTSDAVKVLREQAEHNARTAEAFARAASSQQEAFRALTGLWFGAYRDLFSPFAHAQQAMMAFQRATRQGLEVTEETTKQGLRVAEETAERTEKILRQTEQATREAELRTVVLGALKTTDYDALTVEEVSKRIEGLPTEQLRKVREFEKKNKNRETLIGQIDRKIKAKNS